MERAASGPRLWGLAAILFVGVFLFRFLAFDFDNDHFQTISQGRQILVYGELPFRDFVDPGFFLMPVASAAAQLVFGYNLLGEALLCISLLSAGATLTFLLASQASRSALVGAVAAISVVAMDPRLYHYPKLFLLPLTLFLCWRYADRATLRNLVVLALCTALAFLFRHDHGVYVGLATVVMLIARHWNDERRLLPGRLTLYGAITTATVAPFFLFLEANGGIREYFRSGLEYTRSEARRQQVFTPPAFVLEPPAPPPADIKVRWGEGVSPNVQKRAEERYGLTQSTFLEGRTWQYKIVDHSTSNLSALVNDRRIEDTQNVDRAAYRVHEAPREPAFLAWQRSLGLGIVQPANAIPWLYYLFVSVPLIAVIVLLVTRSRPRRTGTGMSREGAKILTVAALCGVAGGLLLRNPLAARLPDLAAPVAVIAAWLIGQWLGVGRTCPARDRQPGWPPETDPAAISPAPRMGLLLGTGVIAVPVLAIVTWASILAVWEAHERLEDTALLSGPTAVLRRGVQLIGLLAQSPPAEALAPTGRNVSLAHYINQCTKPTDRLLVTSFQPDLYFFSGRAFAGDQIFFYLAYRTSPEDQQRTLARLQGQSVPIVLADRRRYEADIISEFGLIHDYLTRQYRPAREVSVIEPDAVYRVLVDRELVPTGTYEPLDLPCFR